MKLLCSPKCTPVGALPLTTEEADIPPRNACKLARENAFLPDAAKEAQSLRDIMDLPGPYTVARTQRECAQLVLPLDVVMTGSMEMVIASLLGCTDPVRLADALKGLSLHALLPQAALTISYILFDTEMVGELNALVGLPRTGTPQEIFSRVFDLSKVVDLSGEGVRVSACSMATDGKAISIHLLRLPANMKPGAGVDAWRHAQHIYHTMENVQLSGGDPGRNTHLVLERKAKDGQVLPVGAVTQLSVTKGLWNNISGRNQRRLVTDRYTAETAEIVKALPTLKTGEIV